MSYILEALRRAETERERKRRVPGLHAQPVPVLPPEERSPRHGKSWLWGVVGLSAGVLLLPLLWRWWASDPATDDAAGARAAVAGSVTPHSAAAAADGSPAAMPAPVAVPPTASAAAPATPTVQAQPHTPQATHMAPKSPAATAKAATHAKQEPASRSPNVAAAPPTAGTAASLGAMPMPATAPASAPEPRLRSLTELPEDLRRSVPQLAFGGSVYSETAAQRMVIFNGQVLREGDAITDELLLEQIRPHSAVMRLRGQRFEVTF